mmetsp:Transcript_11260/g.20350  ORF Transcript_11260/g.20350 Transcript_11260/m.20350 type:complete len:117 (+) Transcript_11260:1687-2037(+)
MVKKLTAKAFNSFSSIVFVKTHGCSVLTDIALQNPRNQRIKQSGLFLLSNQSNNSNEYYLKSLNSCEKATEQFQNIQLLPLNPLLSSCQCRTTLKASALVSSPQNMPAHSGSGAVV